MTVEMTEAITYRIGARGKERDVGKEIQIEGARIGAGRNGNGYNGFARFLASGKARVIGLNHVVSRHFRLGTVMAGRKNQAC